MMSSGNSEPVGIRSLFRAGARTRDTSERASALADWPDEALMVAVVSRDEVAFAVLYERFSDLVYTTALRVLADPQLAEDTTQDVFVRLWQRPQGFVPERGRFLGWFISVVRNRSVDELRVRGRRRKREPVSIDYPDDLDHQSRFGSFIEDPQASTEVLEQRELIRRALVSLPADQKLALELSYFGGYTQQEIALLLSEPLGTIKTRMRLGMTKLRKALEDRI